MAINEGHVFEMIADNLPIAKVMVFLNQAVIKWLKRGISDWLELNGRKI
ncbi:conserved hypothetical protein [delta proteobacterium NaphS2]|nr:conserved hypothetical protein [delta proteobacterium NaphS2]EFK10582.1 conserved hypothetical protein [delta proteobacterium NaphS2]